MGLFQKIFGKKPEPKGTYEGGYIALDGHTPKFTRSDGVLYSQELIRAAINVRATHISKLTVRVDGTAKNALRNKLKHGPNEWQTWSQFLYRASTILDIHNTCFICPIWDEYGQISGVFTPVPEKCEVVQYGKKPYLRYKFGWGETAAVELEECGILTKYQYKSEYFGEDNKALLPTMDLIAITNQGIEEGVKSAASYKFMAKMTNFAKAEDVAKERLRFTQQNFTREAKGGGLLLFPNIYDQIKQIEMKPWVVDSEQMKLIRENIYDYFGVNEDILQNKAYGDRWSAFYEGVPEAFAIQFSEVMTKMLFTFREQSEGNIVTATANRLQYMSNADKLNVSAAMADRGLMTRNEIREIWNLPLLPPEIGDKLPIRGEYYNLGEEGPDKEPDEPTETEQ